MKQYLLERFLRYVKIDTQSNEYSTVFPSTVKQFDLAKLLVDELHKLGLSDASCDEHCYVVATLQSNTGLSAPVIALFAHLDTSPEVSGSRVNPRVIEKYHGGDIVLRNDPLVIIRESENAHLGESIGHTLVTSDGTTLLGSDDKAGIAAIMTAIEYLVNNPDVKHGTVKVCFTPDEETGHGITNFDIKKLGADFGYTVDGGFTGELNKETFSADSATIELSGVDMHPGYAKDRMVNSVRALAEIITLLPADMAPETTDDYEPYVHPMKIDGCVSRSTMHLILRDFHDDGLRMQKELLESIIDKVKMHHPATGITLQITPSYRNMSDTLSKYPHITERLEAAVRKTGVTPVWKPIRGGTDGSKLTALGLPTPNIFTASCNAHSLTEWQSLDGLVKATETLINVVTAGA